MKTLRKIVLVIAVFAIGLISTKSFGFETVLRVSDKKIIEFKEMMEDIRGVELVFVGEVHSSLKHHKAQLKIIKALNESKIPTAIGLEMIRATSQKELDQWVEGNMAQGIFVSVYNENWGMPWPWYMNIFKYARQYDLPMIGLNLSSEITEKVSRHGLESLTKSEKKQLPSGISFDIDEQYKAHIGKVYEEHDQKGKTFDNFCKAQMIWDKTMAYHLVNFLRTNPGKTIVVLAGTEHAGGKGIPHQIKSQTKYNCKVILPEMAGRVERSTTTTSDADYILME